MFLKESYNHIRDVLLFWILILLITPDLYSSNLEPKKSSKTQKEYTIFPDEYSELDEKSINSSGDNELYQKTLEKARKKYLQGLILIERGDTIKAIQYFETAITVLNKLVSQPGIEKNTEFNDLAKTIMRDYETYISNYDDLDENSSVFVIRDKLFEEVDQITPRVVTGYIKKPLTHEDSATAGLIIKPSVAAMKFTIPIDDNEFVQRSVDFLTQERGKKIFSRWLERSSKWFPMMKRIAKEEGVPEEIIYLSMIESGLNPNAVSSAKAVGLWQFIRSTGEMYGLNANQSVWMDERREPEKSTRAALRHLKDLYNEFGNWHLAMAAYNCGAGGVKRAIKKSGMENPNYWELREYLPRETRNYVPMYIATVKLGVDPKAYGFDSKAINFQKEYEYETYKLKEAISLKALAKCTDLSYEEFCLLNSELINNCTPPDLSEYSLKIPKGTSKSFASKLVELSSEEKQPWISHRVSKGETIRSIAKHYDVSENEIISANSIRSSKSRLKAGTILQIPIDNQKDDDNSQSVASNEEAQKGEVSTSNTPTPSIKVTEKSSPEENSSDESDNEEESSKELITYIVKKDDNLSKIAQRYGSTIDELKEINEIDEDIQAGQRIKVPLNQEQEQKTEPIVRKIKSPKIVKHKVRRGETLNQIAEDYNTSVVNIKKYNKIKRKVKPGQVLKIPVNSGTDLANLKANSYYSQKKVVHKVRSGENLSTIAARYGVQVADIKKWNKGTVSNNSVIAGSRLKIYPSQTSKGSSVSSSKKGAKFYTIRKGDTISTIAKKFGVSQKSIKKLNKNLNETSLKKGKKIRIQ